MQIGLKPDEVLDMSLDMFQACIRGYADRLFDQQILGVQQGYWAGYYGNARKPKPLKVVIEKLLKTKARNAAKGSSTKVIKPEVDVEAFQAMEAQFLKRRQQMNK